MGKQSITIPEINVGLCFNFFLLEISNTIKRILITVIVINNKRKNVAPIYPILFEQS